MLFQTNLWHIIFITYIFHNRSNFDQQINQNLFKILLFRVLINIVHKLQLLMVVSPWDSRRENQRELNRDEQSFSTWTARKTVRKEQRKIKRVVCGKLHRDCTNFPLEKRSIGFGAKLTQMSHGYVINTCCSRGRNYVGESWSTAAKRRHRKAKDNFALLRASVQVEKRETRFQRNFLLEPRQLVAAIISRLGRDGFLPRRQWRCERRAPETNITPLPKVIYHLRTVTSDQTVYNNSSLSFWTRTVQYHRIKIIEK